jgi:oxygen-dependent protoporphyrinogen oxidase
VTSSSASRRSIAIVGGGITGLAAANRIRELAPDAQITLYEANRQLGGVLQTVHADGLLVELSADNFITNVQDGVDLCRRLGMQPDLLATNERGRQAFIVHRGRLVKVPLGFSLLAPTKIWPILSTPLLSPLGKLRVLAEWFVAPRRSDSDESLASFARRRLGHQAFERLVQPLVGGIYTADPEKLSLAATLPRFLEMERTHGSLLRAMFRRTKSTGDEETMASGARYSLFVAPRNGMASLVERLAAQLPPEAIRLGTSAERLERNENGRWRLTVASQTSGEPTPPERIDHDAVIVAAPAFRAARLVAALDADLSAELEQIPYASTTIVALVYRRADVRHPLDGFGFVVPAREQRQILAASFASNKFPGRAPDDQVLIRVFIGGACQAELADLPDIRLQAIAHGELAELLDIRGKPIWQQVARWPRSMPQYHVGHLQRVERIEQRIAQYPGLELAGNAYRGVGVPHCIHSGEQAAVHVLMALQQSTNG